ncbi:hypothetical protein NP493_1667g00001 [Ridgeia piscesae]|uniref:N-acetyltransferase domain-containing protein n=1 Tax=Ridgeia piscesae TaxID=27915 RepID=A0AAD9JXS3_RIDPI|nr:hypothetical protein NP493_1667g00001 [Ridgeia piscesae]
MTPTDFHVVVEWYGDMGSTSRYDLATTFASFPPGRGFYIGELDGEVIASAIRIPWSERVYYGSLYYVAESHRGRGFGTRLRDQVAREHVGENMLAVDAVLGKVADINRTKFGYVAASFLTRRMQAVVRDDVTADTAVYKDGDIVPAAEVAFDRLLAYDDVCFIGRGNPVRGEFLRRWIRLPGGAAYVAVEDGGGRVTGYGCRRPCIDKQPRTHLIGPLYADSPDIAEALLRRLCADVIGQTVVLQFWTKNDAMLALTEKFAFEKVFDVSRMHVNGDPGEYKDTVFALTSIDVCGF